MSFRSQATKCPLILFHVQAKWLVLGRQLISTVMCSKTDRTDSILLMIVSVHALKRVLVKSQRGVIRERMYLILVIVMLIIITWNPSLRLYFT